MITINKLINDNKKSINEDFVKKMIFEFQNMTSKLNEKSDVKHLRNLFKQYINSSKDSSSSHADWDVVDDFRKRATNHFTSLNTLKFIHIIDEEGDRYVDPIINNQIGWWTFQSNQLTNNGGYGKNEISHRFYINANAKVVAEFSEKLVKEFEKRKLPFYFKINTTYTQGPKDFIVIYSSSKELKNTIDVLNSIATQNPYLISQMNIPHIFSNNIDNWLGYAQENKQLQGKESFTGLMSDVISQIFVSSVQEWVDQHPKMSVRSDGMNPVYSSDLVNKNLLEEKQDYYQSKRDKVAYYQGISYMLSAIQRVDYDFINSIIGKLRSKLQDMHIDPDNICLNEDVMKELNTFVNNNSNNSDQELSEKESLQSLRKEYEQMIEKAVDYDLKKDNHQGINR